MLIHVNLNRFFKLGIVYKDCKAGNKNDVKAAQNSAIYRKNLIFHEQVFESALVVEPSKIALKPQYIEFHTL